MSSDPDELFFERLSSAVRAVAVFPPGKVSDFGLLKVLLLEAGKDAHEVLLPTGIDLDSVLTSEQRDQLGTIPKLDEVVPDSSFAFHDICGESSNGLTKRLSFVDEERSSDASKSESTVTVDVELASQSVTYLENPARKIRDIVRSPSVLRALCARTNLGHRMRDGRSVLAIVTRTCTATLTASMQNGTIGSNSSGKAPLSGNCGTEIPSNQNGSLSSSVTDVLSKGTGIVGVSFVCFPVHKQGDTWTLYGGIPVDDSNDSRKAGVLNWIRADNDFGTLQVRKSDIQDVSNVLKEVIVEGSEEGILPPLEGESRAEAMRLFRAFYMNSDPCVADSLAGVSGVDLWAEADILKEMRLVSNMDTPADRKNDPES